ncbi:MAG: hypothetical protein M3Q97_03995 [Bacteroidota bacterium]|nr:hypothetical protein [Bacteroidota bacterium]
MLYLDHEQSTLGLLCFYTEYTKHFYLILTLKKYHDKGRSHHVLQFGRSRVKEFLRDKLDLKATDIGEGWLIFDLTEADMSVHPADKEHGATSGTADISFYCDDIQQTVADLKAKDVGFTR